MADPVVHKFRDGEAVLADEAFLAWTTGDVPRMERALHDPTHPVDRHFLLLSLGNALYSRRDDPAIRARYIEIAEMHRAEIQQLLAAVVHEMRGIVPRVPLFQQLATVYAEDARFAEAIEVCNEALALGLTDGTKSGFSGRVARIMKRSGQHRVGDA